MRFSAAKQIEIVTQLKQTLRFIAPPIGKTSRLNFFDRPPVYVPPNFAK